MPFLRMWLNMMTGTARANLASDLLFRLLCGGVQAVSRSRNSLSLSIWQRDRASSEYQRLRAWVDRLFLTLRRSPTNL